MTLADAQGWKSFNNAIVRKMPEWQSVPSVVYARNELLHYVAMRERGTRYAYSVIERSSGKIIGDFHIKSIDVRRKRAEFGHALHPRVWGTGITYETLDAVRTVARKHGYVLWAKVEESNTRSWKSLERYNATFKGTRVMAVAGKPAHMRVYEI